MEPEDEAARRSVRGQEAGVIASFALLGPAVTENRGWTSYHARQCVSFFSAPFTKWILMNTFVTIRYLIDGVEQRER